MPWDAPVSDPVAALRAARTACGDTFVVDGADARYLFLFSPVGVQSFYALAEADASKGVADWLMLRRKLPDELFAGRRTFPHDLFARDDVAQYRGIVADAITRSLDELGDAGTVDIFELTRRLGHRIGLSTWAGPCGTGTTFDALIAALDQLDGAAAFVDPGAMATVAAAGKREERAALAVAERIIGEAVTARDNTPSPPADHFQQMIHAWAGDPDREIGIARDVVLVHLGSMSNLFAALGWLLVDVATRPELVRRVRAGDADLAERCAMESIRIAQRSIMMRAVMRPCSVADEQHEYAVDRGVTIATLLPLTNCPAGTDLVGFDPDRWQKRRLRADRLPAARELVTTFGHGPHTCPAQPYSLHVMTAALGAILDRYDLEVLDPDARPRPAQIGGIARPATPCRLKYGVRT